MQLKKSLYFSGWCSASDVDNFEDFCDLVVLEQFKNAALQHTATHISEKKVTTAAEAAALADDDTLT